MARPTKRTPETEAKILNALRVGASRKDAADAAGVDYSNFLRWTEQFREFREAVTRAEGEVAARMTARLYQEATKDGGDWKASLEWLKRRRRDDWGDSVSFRKMTDDELIAYVAGGVGGDGAPGPETAPAPADAGNGDPGT
jgi:hypothetical protein